MERAIQIPECADVAAGSVPSSLLRRVSFNYFCMGGDLFCWSAVVIVRFHVCCSWYSNMACYIEF